MGSRGSSSRSSSPIGNAKPVKVINEKHESSRGMWKYTVLEAKQSGKGLTIGHPKADSYEHPNRNTTVANYTLKAGFYNQPGDRSITIHNVNLSKASFVEGQTYPIKDLIKEAGFKWDRKNKRWVK